MFARKSKSSGSNVDMVFKYHLKLFCGATWTTTYQTDFLSSIF